jgi:hypothetical protein
MDWQIRVIEGPDQGLVQELKPGPNMVGRGKAAAVKLSVEDVSWEHALFLRDQDQCFLENLSALGTWVGDTKVNGRVRVRPGDKVRLTEQTVLRVESVGGSGARRALLISAVLAMLVILGAVAYYQVLAPRASARNWDRTYNELAPWVKTQVKNHRMPPETASLFDNAWRLSEAGDWPASQKAWTRLQIVLSAPECKVRCFELAAEDPQYKVVDLISAPPPGFEPSDDQSAAALGDFVDGWLKQSLKMQKSLNPLKPN